MNAAEAVTIEPSTDQESGLAAGSGAGGMRTSGSQINETGTADPARSDANAAAQFISFAIDDEYYCVDIIAVREIKGWTEVTRLPNQPTFVRGVLNLRGVVVPIIDLRCKFGQGLTDATPTHVVIIVQIEERLVGLLVDRVSDILQVDTERFQPVPQTCGLVGVDYLSGLVTVNEQMIALLDLHHLSGTTLGSPLTT